MILIASLSVTCSQLLSTQPEYYESYSDLQRRGSDKRTIECELEKAINGRPPTELDVAISSIRKCKSINGGLLLSPTTSTFYSTEHLGIIENNHLTSFITSPSNRKITARSSQIKTSLYALVFASYYLPLPISCLPGSTKHAAPRLTVLPRLGGLEYFKGGKVGSGGKGKGLGKGCMKRHR